MLLLRRFVAIPLLAVVGIVAVCGVAVCGAVYLPIDVIGSGIANLIGCGRYATFACWAWTAWINLLEHCAWTPLMRWAGW